ncbi:MAG: hypothetical protein WB471_06775 [Nocardioides sp.]
MRGIVRPSGPPQALHPVRHCRRAREHRGTDPAGVALSVAAEPAPAVVGG